MNFDHVSTLLKKLCEEGINPTFHPTSQDFQLELKNYVILLQTIVANAVQNVNSKGFNSGTTLEVINTVNLTYQVLSRIPDVINLQMPLPSPYDNTLHRPFFSSHTVEDSSQSPPFFLWLLMSMICLLKHPAENIKARQSVMQIILTLFELIKVNHSDISLFNALFSDIVEIQKVLLRQQVNQERVENESGKSCYLTLPTMKSLFGYENSTLSIENTICACELLQNLILFSKELVQRESCFIHSHIKCQLFQLAEELLSSSYIKVEIQYKDAIALLRVLSTELCRFRVLVKRAAIILLQYSHYIIANVSSKGVIPESSELNIYLEEALNRLQDEESKVIYPYLLEIVLIPTFTNNRHSILKELILRYFLMTIPLMGFPDMNTMRMLFFSYGQTSKRFLLVECMKKALGNLLVNGCAGIENRKRKLEDEAIEKKEKRLRIKFEGSLRGEFVNLNSNNYVQDNHTQIWDYIYDWILEIKNDFNENPRLKLLETLCHFFCSLCDDEKKTITLAVADFLSLLKGILRNCEDQQLFYEALSLLYDCFLLFRSKGLMECEPELLFIPWSTLSEDISSLPLSFPLSKIEQDLKDENIEELRYKSLIAIMMEEDLPQYLRTFRDTTLIGKLNSSSNFPSSRFIDLSPLLVVRCGFEVLEFFNENSDNNSHLFSYLPCAICKSLITKITFSGPKIMVEYKCQYCEDKKILNQHRELNISEWNFLWKLVIIWIQHPKKETWVFFEKCIKHLSTETICSIHNEVTNKIIESFKISQNEQTTFLMNILKQWYLNLIQKGKNGVLTEVTRALSHFLKNDEFKDEPCKIRIAGNLGILVNDELCVHFLEAIILNLCNPKVAVRVLAYHELESFFKKCKIPTRDFLRPLWPILSIFLSDYMLSNPDVVNRFSEFLGISTYQLLQRNTEYIIPYLVSRRKRDILEEVTRQLNEDVDYLCMNEIHHILAYIFLEENQEVEEAISFFLSVTSYECQNISVVELIKSCSLQFITKLALELGENDERKKSKGIQALKRVCKYMNSCEYKNNELAPFLKQYSLGILSHITEIVVDIKGYYSLKAKRKAIQSLSHLMGLIGRDIYNLKTQIMATLHTCFKYKDLRLLSLKCWSVFVRTLDVKSIGPIIDQVTATLLSLSPSWDKNEIGLVHDIFQYAILECYPQLKGEISKVYGVPQIPEFSNITQKILQAREKKGILDFWKDVLVSISSDNPFIVQQALIEFKCVAMGWNRDTSAHCEWESLLAITAHTLLSTCRKFLEVNSTIARACAECLGIIGAVDIPQSRRIEKAHSNSFGKFENRNDTLLFTCTFIKTHLFEAFRSAPDTKIQNHLAYTLQELLKICGFTPAVVEAKAHKLKKAEDKKLYNLWNSFSEDMREILAPLLTSKYTIQMASISNTQYPIYLHKDSFSEWLKAWALDLSNRVKFENASRLFSICQTGIKSGEVNLAKYLLPHIVLCVILSGNEQDKKLVLEEITAVLKDVNSKGPGDIDERGHLSAQVVFSTIDHWNTFIKDFKLNEGVTKSDERSRLKIESVEAMIQAIAKDTLAEASFRCKAYALSLFHLELHIRSLRSQSEGKQLQKYYKRMQEIYNKLEIPDAIEGIFSLMVNPALEEQLLENESTGKWATAQTCYEVALRLHPERLDYRIGLINCLKHLGHNESVLTQLASTGSGDIEYTNMLNSIGIEAAWRLGKWEAVEEYSLRGFKNDFDAELGELLLCLHQKEKTKFYTKLSLIYGNILGPLAAASAESYRRSYDYIVKLHVLNDIERGFQFFIHHFESNEDRMNELTKLLQEWDKRLNLLSPSYKIKELIISLKRILLSEERISTNSESMRTFCNKELGSSWVEFAKAARKVGYYQTAFGAILNAELLNYPIVHIQKAKLQWDQGAHNIAVKILEKHKVDLNEEDIHIRAKTSLLLAKWMEQSHVTNSETIINQYLSVTKMQEKWEDSFFYFGRYFNKLFENEKKKSTMKELTKSEKKNIHRLRIQCFEKYNLAMKCGTKFIYQTMPKILTLWLDYGCEDFSQSDEELKSFLNFNKAVRRLVDQIPPYQFLTAFPQILSRICHRNKDLYDVLELIIMKVMISFPQQAMWHIASVSKSSTKIRSTRCTNIFVKIKVY